MRSEKMESVSQALSPLLLTMSDGAREHFIEMLGRAEPLTQENYPAYEAEAYNSTVGFPHTKADQEYVDEYFYAVDCPVCKNRYFVAYVNGDNVCIHRACSCVAKRDSIIYARKSGLEDLLRHRLNNFQDGEDWQKLIKSKAVSFIRERDGNWFGAFGQSGAGKTHICAAICNKLLDEGRRVKYLKWVSFSKRIERLRFDDERRDEEFDQYANADVLYIDDLLKGANLKNVTEPALALELIERRISKRGGYTLISGELVPKELARIDEALAGRIVEKCGKYLVNLPRDSAKNYRLR